MNKGVCAELQLVGVACVRVIKPHFRQLEADRVDLVYERFILFQVLRTGNLFNRGKETACNDLYTVKRTRGKLKAEALCILVTKGTPCQETLQ